MSSNKRKRRSRDVPRVFFPDDVDSGVLRASRVTPALSSVSSARSWERCGDGFTDTALMKNLQPSGRKVSAGRKVTRLSAAEQTLCAEDQLPITWSSSDSDQADGDAQRRTAPKAPTAPSPASSRALLPITSDEDDLPEIKSDSDADESDRDEERLICESSDEGQTEESPPQHSQLEEVEISGFDSDSEDVGGTLTSSRLDILPPLCSEGGRRSLGHLLKSAQAMLQTPQKHPDRQARTPEDSAKKTRKFQRGGLAERLHLLQSRQRSAVSFWKHQRDSSAVDRPGVLRLEVFEVHQECSMTLTRCEHHHQLRSPEEGDPAPEDRAMALVLFSRETAAQLTPAPRDIIHVYPPWQSLSVEGFSCPIILNTHFSQKVSSDLTHPGGRLCAQSREPYDLGKTFGRLEPCSGSSEDSVQQASAAGCNIGGLWGPLPSVSLLEAIEGLGQAGSMEQDVEVVVQRVYSIPVPGCSPASRVRSRSRSCTAHPPAENHRTRLCVLVQDQYGTFSVIQLHLLPCSEDLHQHRHMWQGKSCVLRGIKVMQRLTRERSCRLFSLIDSLWPPVTPLRQHGGSAGPSGSLSSGSVSSGSPSSDSRAAGPAPSFCYLLSGQQSSVQPGKARTASLLYIQPAERSLRDVLQSHPKTQRCSFTATVLYKRMQSGDVGQAEFWLVLTDCSLQEDRPDRPSRRTLPLCIKPSCVLTSSVLTALRSTAADRMAFTDAVIENGVLLCVEQSVIEMSSAEPEIILQSTTRTHCQELPEPEASSLPRPEASSLPRPEASSLPRPEASSLPRPEASSLPRPVRLDPLSLEAAPGWLCCVSGLIAAVDENSSFSWPVCSGCGSDDLETSPEALQRFCCVSCGSAVDKPDTKVQLEVFLSCSSLTDCTVKVKLQQESIQSILNVTALQSSEFSGFDVESILGKEVGPLNVYVRAVGRSPARWMGLEEVRL